MKAKALIFIFLIILIMPYAVADLNYTQSGESDSFYIRGTGSFNGALDPADTIITTKVISDPEQIPLIADVDGDGITEIFIIADENLIAIQNKSLTTSATFALNGTSDEHYSNMILFDIDGDGTLELIVASEETEVLHIINYSNGVFSPELRLHMNAITHTSTSNNAGKITIGCESANRCLMYYGETNKKVSQGVYAAFFNSTAIANERKLVTIGSNQMFCPPKIRHIAIANYDSASDSDVEFIFSGIAPDLSSGDDGVDYFVFWVDILSNNTPNLEGTASITGSETAEIFGADNFACDNSAGANSFLTGGDTYGIPIPSNFITAPLVFDADPDEAGLETIIGFMVNREEFKMRLYKPDRTKKRDFPSIQKSEGQLLSNVFRAEIFDDSSSEQDFCIIGHQATDEQVSLTCGSLNDGDGVGIFNTQSIEFRGTDFAVGNVTDNYAHWGMLSHAVEYDESNSVSEITTTWGIIEPIFSGILCTFGIDAVDCNLDLIFRNPKQDGTVVPVDYDEVNLEDLLILTTTNFFYIDDGFENSPANEFCGEPGSVTGTCTEWSINPCIESVWAINTTVEITVTGKDPESDLVQSSVTLYEGDSNELLITSANVSSGTEVPFPFNANKTIGAGNILFTVADIVENPADIKTMAKSFSVAPNGVEFGDCITTVTAGTDDEAVDGVIADATLTEDATDNAVTSGVNTFSGITGLAGTTIWLLFMMLGAFFIYSTMAERGLSGNSALGTIAIVEVLAIILGARLGIFSTGLVVTIVVVGVVIIGVFLGKTFKGTTTE